MPNKVVSYIIRGGNPFRLTIFGNPEIEHDGSQTIGHLYATLGEVSAISEYISNFGCQVEFWEMQEQTQEQEKERQDLLGFQKEDAVFPTAKCPECAWFDPLVPTYCGLNDWPPESKQTLLANTHHMQHLNECPSPHYWQKDNFPIEGNK